MQRNNKNGTVGANSSIEVMDTFPPVSTFSDATTQTDPCLVFPIPSVDINQQVLNEDKRLSKKTGTLNKLYNKLFGEEKSTTASSSNVQNSNDNVVQLNSVAAPHTITSFASPIDEPYDPLNPSFEAQAQLGRLVISADAKNPVTDKSEDELIQSDNE